MAQQVDVYQARKRRRQRVRLRRFVVFMIVVGIAIFVYVKRDVWYPELEGIGSRYNITQNENADTEGNFPLSVSGGVDYYASFVRSEMFILCDMYLYIYNADGTLKDTRQHAYSNAVLKTSSSRSLVYSCNGTSFRVDNASKLLYEYSFEQSILFADISDDGYVAVVTEAETRPCTLSIFDSTGKLIYTRECGERIADVSLTSEGCVFATIGAENGELITQLKYITFDSDEIQWTTDSLTTLCMNVYALSEGGALVIGDTRCAYYSSTGALLSSYDFTGTLIDYEFSDDYAAILLQNEERRQSTLLIFSEAATAPASVQRSEICESLTITDNTVYLLEPEGISAYAFSGDQKAFLELTNSYEGILQYGKYFYLLGYDKIDRISTSNS